MSPVERPSFCDAVAICHSRLLLEYSVPLIVMLFEISTETVPIVVNDHVFVSVKIFPALSFILVLLDVLPEILSLSNLT